MTARRITQFSPILTRGRITDRSTAERSCTRTFEHSSEFDTLDRVCQPMELGGHPVRVRRQFDPQVVVEHRVELCREEAHF